MDTIDQICAVFTLWMFNASAVAVGVRFALRKH